MGARSSQAQKVGSECQGITVFHWKRIPPPHPFPTLGNCFLGLQLCIHKFSSLDYTKNTYNLKVFILKELNNVPRLRDMVHIMKLLKLLIILQGIWFCITKGQLQQVGLLRRFSSNGSLDWIYAFITASYCTCLNLLSPLHVRSYQHTFYFLFPPYIPLCTIVRM